MTEHSAALVPIVEVDPRVSLGVLRADGPKQLLAVATEAADALRGVISQKKLFSTINGREYVRVEGWTTLATMMGCLPREVSVSRDEKGTYTATVELVRMGDQAVLTRASAECGMDERTWASRADYARRSMAVTRATSKACRIAFSWVMVLAGYEATPQEEIPHDEAPVVRHDPKKRHPEPVVPLGRAEDQPLSEFPRNLQDAADEPIPTVALNVAPPPADKPDWRKPWPWGSLKGRELWTLSTDELVAQRNWAEKSKRGADLVPIIEEILKSREGL